MVQRSVLPSGDPFTSAGIQNHSWARWTRNTYLLVTELLSAVQTSQAERSVGACIGRALGDLVFPSSLGEFVASR